MKLYKYCALLVIAIILLVPPKTNGQARSSHDSASRLERIHKSGILRMGVPGDYAPFAIILGDSLYGADIKLGRSLAAAMSVRPQFVKTSWSNLSIDMRNDAFDIALGGISITAERSKLASFSIPYHVGGKTFLCRRADSATFSTPAAVNKPGVRLIVNRGGTNESVARALFPAATLQVYPNNIGVFDELLAGRADVMLTDDTEADLKARQYAQLCRSYPGTVTESDKALWIQTDAELVRFVNNWLQKAIESAMTELWLKEAMLPGH